MRTLISSYSALNGEILENMSRRIRNIQKVVLEARSIDVTIDGPRWDLE